MAYEQKPNSGSLWPNNRKEKETHPDLTGTLEVEGKLYWISGWEKQSKQDGKLWISLSVKPKDAASASASRPMPTAGKWSRPVAPAAPAQAEPAKPATSDDNPPDEVPF